MGIDRKILYSFAYSLLGFLLLALFIPNAISKYIIAIFLALFAFSLYKFVKKRSVLSIHKKEVILLISVFGVVYLMIYYLFGIKFGFLKSYVFNFELIIKSILPTTIIIISCEVIRYVFLAQKRKEIDIVTFICCILIDFMLVYNIYSFKNFNSFMDAIGLTILPSITFNILYHSLSKNYGFIPNIIFRLITSLYLYIIPVVPATPDSLVAIFKLLLPLFILWFIRMLYNKTPKTALNRSTGLSYIAFSITIFLMLCLMILVSNQFRFGAIVIATPSMQEELNIGDVIIYKETDNDDIISVGQIIVFEKNDFLVVHRVEEIEYVDGILRYYTKGDANEKRDEGFITNADIVGSTDFKIPYVGYPTLWLRDLFE